MAKIVTSKNAPSEPFVVSFGAGLVKPGDKSDDRALLVEAANHPWLEVEWDKAELLGGDVIPPAVDPTKDPLSAQGPNADLPFDPEAVKADTDRVLHPEAELAVAIEPTLDQDKGKTEGGVAKTVAASDKATEKASK